MPVTGTTPVTYYGGSGGMQLVYGYSYYMNAASVCVEYGVSFVVYLFNIENAEEKETGTTGRKHV